jgi:hypothetical protein
MHGEIPKKEFTNSIKIVSSKFDQDLNSDLLRGFK